MLGPSASEFGVWGLDRLVRWKFMAKMGPACRKVQEKLPGNRAEALFCRTGTNFSFTLIYVYGIGVLCQSFGTRVASLFRTGARGRNIPSNSKKAYQSFEAQDWQDVSILLILTSKVHVSHIFRPKTDTAKARTGEWESRRSVLEHGGEWCVWICGLNQL